MRRHPAIILASLLMLASACSRDFDEEGVQQPASETVAEEGYAVSVEQALKSLDNELAMIGSGDETRAPQPRRRVKAVRSVAYEEVAPATRSAEMPDDVADLFYIVEFADGQGSAVLGADKRVEPVLAILDETVITPEDFASADIESDDITSYISAIIANGATAQLALLPGIERDTTRLPIDKFWGPGKDTVVNYKQTPMLNTKWHQDSPYNDMCSAGIDENGILQHYKAGCGPVAIGQILVQNQYSPYITINGDTFDVDLLKRCSTGVVPSFAAQMEAARFIYKIGLYTNAIYDTGSTSILDRDVPALFSHVGYKSVTLQYFDLSKARNMVCSNNLVFYMSGKNSGNTDGHIWVVDGWNEYTVRTWNCYYDTHGGTDMEILDRVLLSSETYTKMHCNFGWGGKSDGYYSYNLFNTTQQLGADDIDASAGDIRQPYSSESDYIFNSAFNMITYSLQ